ncbi:uncharacterized protein [Periplaneta americana]
MFASLKNSFSRLFGNSDPEKKKQESTNKPKEGKECTDQGPNRIPSMSEGTEDCSRNPVSEPVIEKSRNFITNESRLSSFETEDLFDLSDEVGQNAVEFVDPLIPSVDEIDSVGRKPITEIMG